jgi:hypothetical protein
VIDYFYFICRMLCLLQKILLINFNQIQDSGICLAVLVTKCALKIVTGISVLIVHILQRKQPLGNTINFYNVLFVFYTFY